MNALLIAIATLGLDVRTVVAELERQWMLGTATERVLAWDAETWAGAPEPWARVQFLQELQLSDPTRDYSRAIRQAILDAPW